MQICVICVLFLFKPQIPLELEKCYKQGIDTAPNEQTIYCAPRPVFGFHPIRREPQKFSAWLVLFGKKFSAWLVLFAKKLECGLLQ